MPGPTDHRLIKHIPALNELKIRRRKQISIQQLEYSAKPMIKEAWTRWDGSPKKGVITRVDQKRTESQRKKHWIWVFYFQTF